jgi:hypothetical protein
MNGSGLTTGEYGRSTECNFFVPPLKRILPQLCERDMKGK